MASAYHHAPNHIRRMLNQLLFEHVYLVPYDDTRQLTTTATCMPPFDSILGWGGSPTDNEQTLPEGEESMKPLTTDPGERDEEQAANLATAASDQPHTLQPPGTAQTLPVPRGHEVAGGHEVANTRPDMQPPNQQSCPKPPKTVQNKPCSTQKPTPEVSQDVGLSVEHLVGVTGLKPATSRSQTARAINCATPRHTTEPPRRPWAIIA